MKKILIVANVAKEHILKFHIPTIKMLKDMGYEVHVACAGKEKVPYCNKQWEMEYERNPFSLKTIKGIKQMKKIIREENYDVVHCHTPTGGLVARIASKDLQQKKQIKVIYTAHGFHFYKGAPIINWLCIFPVEKYLSKFTNILITINEEDYNNVKKYKFKNDITLKLPGVGVNLNKYAIHDSRIRENYRKELKIPNDAFVLIYVAELIKNKNQVLILNALKIVQNLIPNCYVLFVGPDHTNNKFENYIKANKYKNVILTGWRNDIPELLNCADCYVASSIREGLGINLIEAMSVGLPVVATNNRGHRDIINNCINGYLVSQNDYKKMADDIINIFQNRELREKFVLNGYKTIQYYSQNNILKKLKKIYESEV